MMIKVAMKKQIRQLSALSGLLRAGFFAKRFPLVVAWAVTYRCNYRCKYCAAWKAPAAELGTGEICNIIDEMAGMAVKKISFTGGEPLLREDMGKIIDYSHQKNISVNLNSNGSLIKKRISELKNLSALTLSLEGPEEIHDRLRQRGSFKDVLDAADAAIRNNIKVIFTSTLNTYNLDSIDYLLGLAMSYNAQIQFQPSIKELLAGSEENPVALHPSEYHAIMKKIIERKGGMHKRTIRNSLAGLMYLSKWPNLEKLRCASGLITCRIQPDGTVLHCDRMPEMAGAPLNCAKDGFGNAFYSLPVIFCKECCCALRVEAAHMLKLSICALVNAYLSEKG